jgi:hypothetical protein
MDFQRGKKFLTTTTNERKSLSRKGLGPTRPAPLAVSPLVSRVYVKKYF